MASIKLIIVILTLSSSVLLTACGADESTSDTDTKVTESSNTDNADSSGNTDNSAETLVIHSQDRINRVSVIDLQ